ncbi:thiamine diphosphokinase [Roseisalinus antarcticus]|uniref:Thiamine diphosphokinase n=1 Tax=Roseisalinus antarcticus TaxID=254357 RepID=A0A1Y5SFP5_9RHOB|nr:thiamine diphosphokinase [Roseisalinus antarcticus]SLN39737.1 Thiamin pyrophosphokinase, catalytic domain [Roseisalinus antarcticus]
MNGAIVLSDAPVTLIGGGVTGPEDLALARAHAPRLVAADGGGDSALAAGCRPEAVIGDMDSLSPAGRDALAEVLHPVSEQETTDFDKALCAIDAPLVLAVGMTGGRIDHDLAAFNVLVRRAARRCVVIGAESLVFLAPPVLELDVPVGSLVSLFPMGPVTGRSEGLEWPIDGLGFAPWGRSGTSNAASGPVRLEFSDPRMLVILPREALADVVEALGAQGSGWPG